MYFSTFDRASQWEIHCAVSRGHFVKILRAFALIPAVYRGPVFHLFDLHNLKQAVQRPFHNSSELMGTLPFFNRRLSILMLFN
jgi:hypothetical protein